MTSQTLNPFQSPQKKKLSPPPANFVEALKSIGGQTMKSFSQDVVGGVSRDVMGTFIGGTTPSEKPYGQDQYTPDWLQKRDAEIKAEAEKRARHKEIINTPVFDRREQEVKAKIESLQKELQQLAKDLAAAGSAIQKAVAEEVVNPGTYHLAFFEKLRNFIIMLRKQVAESQNWLEMSAARKASQRHYQQGVQKSGTKFSLSQERQIATSVG